MEHFIFLLEKLGFEVKQGKHIAVKVPGMKRFKRLDTISEDLCRESLEAMFRYGDASLWGRKSCSSCKSSCFITAGKKSCFFTVPEKVLCKDVSLASR